MLSIITFTLHPSETQSQETKKLIGTFVPCRKRRKKNEKVLKVVFLKFYNLILMVSIAEAGIPLLLIYLTNSL